MPVPLIVIFEADLTLTAVALGFSLRARGVPATVVSTVLLAIGVALAWFMVLVLWAVAPSCIGAADQGACVESRIGMEAFTNVLLGAGAESAWLVGVALGARFAATRDLAHVSG